MKSLVKGISDRMADAGGVYNFGNMLDLYAVAASAVVARHPETVGDALSTVYSQFTGDPSSIFLSTAALVFFAGGEAYHQAWKNGFPPKKWANFSGDFLSGVGALLLGAGLYGLGEPVLAASSGGLHALSKFGSSLGVSEKLNSVLNREFKLAGYVTTGMGVIKDLALVSRIPALAICAADVANNLSALPWPQAVSKSVMPVILAWCYLEWGRADHMLLQPTSLLKQIGANISTAWDKVITSRSLPSYFSSSPVVPTQAPGDLETIKEVRRADVRHLSAVAAIVSITTISATMPLRGGAFVVALPLFVKTICELAKAGATADIARRKLSRLTSNEVIEPNSASKRMLIHSQQGPTG